MKKTIFYATIVILIQTSCKDNTKKQAMINQEIENNLGSFRQKKLNECRSMALDSANKLADSIVLMRNTTVDTALVNAKPKKPTKPIIKSALDTTPVQPLFKK